VEEGCGVIGSGGDAILIKRIVETFGNRSEEVRQ
jgi:hypothetical protein